MDVGDHAGADTEAEAREVETKIAWRPELRSAARYAGIVFLSMRGALTLLALLAVALLPPEDGRAVDPGWQNLLDAWQRWDADWFLRIAGEGYDPGNGSAAFFPLYPLLVRAVAAPFGDGYLGSGFYL